MSPSMTAKAPALLACVVRGTGCGITVISISAVISEGVKVPAQRSTTQQLERKSRDRSRTPETELLSGWFHVISNGEPRFMLIDDRGGWTEILLDEALARPVGGPRALNGKRVKILGERVQAASGIIRVLTIELD